MSFRFFSLKIGVFPSFSLKIGVLHEQRWQRSNNSFLLLLFVVVVSILAGQFGINTNTNNHLNCPRALFYPLSFDINITISGVKHHYEYTRDTIIPSSRFSIYSFCLHLVHLYIENICHICAWLSPKSAHHTMHDIMKSQVHGSEASIITTQACDFQYISSEDFTLQLIPNPQSQPQTSICRNLVEDKTCQEIFEGLSSLSSINHLEPILTPHNIFSDKKLFPSVLNKVKSSGRKIRFAYVVSIESNSKITLDFFSFFFVTRISRRCSNVSIFYFLLG